jgi:release factor glutamine methyltransferase
MPVTLATKQNSQTPQFATLLAEVKEFWIPLVDKPEETPEDLLRALWLTASGRPVSATRASRMRLPALDAAAAKRLRQLLERKKSGEPLAHLTERQNFLGLELLAGPAALIPRKETEILGRALLAKLKALAQERGEVTVVDVCTGSGNLALAYAHHEPRARVHASDLSQEAVDLACRNCRYAGLESRVEFRQGDLLTPFECPDFLGKCDVLSCNPPYISAGKVPEMHPEIAGFEPQLAFNGGAYGISILTKLLRNASRFLRPASWLGFEVGRGQGPALEKQLKKNPAFSEVEAHTDSAGESRALLARTR